MPPPHLKTSSIKYPEGCRELSEELSKDELLKRLKGLARAFQDMGQEEENTEYKELALYLASEFFLEHTNRDVKLLVACCIADIFRIFAPEAPYTDADQLKEIFVFLTRQLKGLENPDSGSFKRYFYLLENLAWVKSFNICLELEDNQEILCELFKLITTIISDAHSIKVVNFILDMLSPLITEADTVSQDLLDIILLPILEPHKSMNKQAFVLMKELIVRTSASLEPYLQTFFNNVMLLGKTSESELSDRFYDLIYELNSISPSILLTVMPQLEFKLKSAEVKERSAVTKLLSKIFSEPQSTLATQHRPLWACYLGRFKDIEADIRKMCVTASLEFMLNQPDLVPDITDCLLERSHDTDENIRLEVITMMVNVVKKDHTKITDQMMTCFKDRALDKKFKIRKEALLGLGLIYRKTCGKENATAAEIDRVMWIADKVLHTYYQSSAEDRILVERIMNMYLVRYSQPSQERMKQLLKLYATVDDHAVKAIHELFKTQFLLSQLLQQVIQLEMSGPSDQGESQMNLKLSTIAKHLYDPVPKAMEVLRKFLKMIRADQRLRTTIGRLLSNDCASSKAEDYVKEILKKCGAMSATNHLLTNVKVLLERVAPVTIDVEAIKNLVFLLDEAINKKSQICLEIPHVIEKGMNLLLALSHSYGGRFNDEETFHVLISFIRNSDETVCDHTVQIFSLVGQHLEKDFPDVFASLSPILQKLVKIGTPVQAKHAIYCINNLCTLKRNIFSKIFEQLQANIQPDSPNLLTSLVATGHMAYLSPGEFADPVQNIVSKVIVKQILKVDRGQGSSSSDDWVEDHLLSEELHAKIQSLKLMQRWLMGIKNNKNNQATFTLKLLYTLIVHEGDLMQQRVLSKAEMARLRLQAACCMLKLAQERAYEPLITLEQFQALALLINDSCYQVRAGLAHKLHRALLSLKLPLQYLSIFCLAPNDPCKERRQQIKHNLQMNICRRREFIRTNSAANAKMFSILPDYVLPYAIHLLAHDPDYESNGDLRTLKNIRECLWFLIEPLISKNENYSYSFYRRLIENIKQTKDMQCPDDEVANKKLYAVCDLALSLVSAKSANMIMKDFPAEPILPSKLFTVPDMTKQNSTNYLPKELIGQEFKNKKSFATGLGLIPSAQPQSPPPVSLSPMSSPTRSPVIVTHQGLGGKVTRVVEPIATNVSGVTFKKTGKRPGPATDDEPNTKKQKTVAQTLEETNQTEQQEMQEKMPVKPARKRQTLRKETDDDEDSDYQPQISRGKSTKESDEEDKPIRTGKQTQKQIEEEGESDETLLKTRTRRMKTKELSDDETEEINPLKTTRKRQIRKKVEKAKSDDEESDAEEPTANDRRPQKKAHQEKTDKRQLKTTRGKTPPKKATDEEREEEEENEVENPVKATRLRQTPNQRQEEQSDEENDKKTFGRKAGVKRQGPKKAVLDNSVTGEKTGRVTRTRRVEDDNKNDTKRKRSCSTHTLDSETSTVNSPLDSSQSVSSVKVSTRKSTSQFKRPAERSKSLSRSPVINGTSKGQVHQTRSSPRVTKKQVTAKGRGKTTK